MYNEVIRPSVNKHLHVPKKMALNPILFEYIARKFCCPTRGPIPSPNSILQAKRHLTPMANLKGAKRPFLRSAASANTPDDIAAIPDAHVAIRKVSPRKCDGNPRLWCSVTIHVSNAVASRVTPTPAWNIKKRKVENDSEKPGRKSRATCVCPHKPCTSQGTHQNITPSSLPSHNDAPLE